MRRLLPTIVHLDADAFFVAVEQALNPTLRGKKVAVGGRERGIIASASYEARACGVYTPMPTSQALRICPDLILISNNHGRYSEYSRKLFDLCENITPLVERRSIDEGFMDVEPCGFANEQELIDAIKDLQDRITRDLDISVSFGLATNKLVSAVASKKSKPHGFTVVRAGDEASFLANLPISVIPGVGKKTEVLLKANGIVLVKDILSQTESALKALLGNGWRDMVSLAQGEDDSVVATEHEDAKSYSQQETFIKDISDFSEISRIAKGMLDELMAKVRADGKRARTLTIKVRYPGMDNDTTGRSLPEATDLEADFYGLIEPLLRAAWRQRRPLRLVAVRLSGIEGKAAQLELFSETDEKAERKRRLASVVDALNSHKGTAVRHGHQIKKNKDSADPNI